VWRAPSNEYRPEPSRPRHQGAGQTGAELGDLGGDLVLPAPGLLFGRRRALCYRVGKVTTRCLKAARFKAMPVQRVLMPTSGAEPWTVLDDNGEVVELVECYLAYLAAIGCRHGERKNCPRVSIPP
jgi:hypothetical protein